MCVIYALYMCDIRVVMMREEIYKNKNRRINNQKKVKIDGFGFGG